MQNRVNAASAPAVSCAVSLATLAGLSVGLALLAPATHAADQSVPAVRLHDGTPDASIYINYGSGERIVSTEAFEPADSDQRSGIWSWSANATDPCAPPDFEGTSPTPIFTQVHDDDFGDKELPDAIGYWHDWFEYPPNSIVDSILLRTFSQIPDVDNDGNGVGDGVEGLDWFLVFTENDDPNNRANAIAHSPILLDSIPGSLDVGSPSGDIAGDGVIGFQEGQLILQIIDFAAGDVPTDIEIGDTNGVPDGSFGADSIYSGIPGVDLDGDGLINGGFVVGFRQPGVAEGDGLITRFPELAGIGLENPDGPLPDASTFPNIRPVGFPVAGPSENAESYENRPAGQLDWPYNPAYTPEPGEGTGAFDGYARLDADGVDTGLQWAGLFACDPGAKSPPFSASPWFTCEIVFNTGIVCRRCSPGGCTLADNAEPFGVLDLADISGFIIEFQTDCGPAADIAEPFGVCDLADIGTFVTEFQTGCP